jgi:hypothetical protein
MYLNIISYLVIHFLKHQLSIISTLLKSYVDVNLMFNDDSYLKTRGSIVLFSLFLVIFLISSFIQWNLYSIYNLESLPSKTFRSVCFPERKCI